MLLLKPLTFLYPYSTIKCKEEPSCRIEADYFKKNAANRTNIEEKEAFKNTKDEIKSFETENPPQFQRSRSPSNILTLDQSNFGSIGKEVDDKNNIPLPASELNMKFPSLSDDQNLPLIPKDESQTEHMTSPLFDPKPMVKSHNEKSKLDVSSETVATQIMSPLKKDKKKLLESEFSANEGASSVNLPVNSKRKVSQLYQRFWRYNVS